VLRQQEVDAREERCASGRPLARARRRSSRAFYQAVRHELRDPDTYAVLNWFFVAGLHHFYLRRWARGALDLGVFVLGLVLIFTGAIWIGMALIAAVAVLELWALFRAQIIVQDWNNHVYAQSLKRHGVQVD
jgi:TM2 domain-containing membrane protein YozV